LGRAYELGRRALEEQVSVVELASLHHQVLIDLIRTSENEQRKEELLRSSAEFLSECVSPYEMAHRGFQDAVKALRQLNETLEEEIKRIAYAVHDEAGATAGCSPPRASGSCYGNARSAAGAVHAD